MVNAFMKKRDNNETTLGQAIQQLLETYKLKHGVDEAGLINSWEAIMGTAIAKRTSNIYFKSTGRLHIKLESSTLRNELRLGRVQLIDMLNEKLGKEVVKEIHFD
jgi:predicted nucleic acid-binding Zn ribbon protein